MQTQIVLSEAELKDAVKHYVGSAGVDVTEPFGVEFKATVNGPELTQMRAIAVISRPAEINGPVTASGTLGGSNAGS